MENFLNKIINGNSIEVLKTLPDNSIDCCVTSPPYWGLRDYGAEMFTLARPPTCGNTLCAGQILSPMLIQGPRKIKNKTKGSKF